MLMLWMCCLSFAQEEKNELGLLLGSEFIPRAATTSNQKVSLGRSVAYSVDYAAVYPAETPPCSGIFRSVQGRVSSSRKDRFSTFSQLRRGHPLVNMEDRMLDRFADY